MYSILNKEGRQGEIVHFLADTDHDLVLITDACAPGSTVKVLGNDSEDLAGVKGIHTFIKAPDNLWTLYEGESKFEVPTNDAKVSVPAQTAVFGNQTAADFQEDVTIYPTGLVKGTLKQATCEELYGSSQKDGHFFCADLEIPAGASQYSINFDGKQEEPNRPVDGWLMVRYENLPTGEEKEKKPKTVKVAYDTGESFTFDLGYVDLQ